MAYNVKFLKGTLEAYNGLATKDVNTFYYAGNDLFLGEIKLSNGADLAAAILRIAENETDIASIQQELGALTGSDSGKSISQMIESAVEAAKTELEGKITAEENRAKGVEQGLETRLATVEGDYLTSTDKTELEGKIKTNTDAITVLNGNDQTVGSVDKKIADAFNEFITTETADEVVNTYKELIDYAKNHGSEATEMAAAIDALETKVGEKTVAAQISEAITAENLSQYATDTELAALTTVVSGKASQTDLDIVSGKVTTAEEKITALEGKLGSLTDVEDAIATAKQEAINTAAGDATTKANTAEQNAKDYADSLATNYDGTGSADAALASAKSYADGKDAETLQSAKDYADGLAGNYDAAGSASAAQEAAKTYTDNAILALDADVTSAAVEAGKGVQVQVVEVDGKVTTVNVTGNYDNSYDAKGAAATAESNAAADATTKANTAEANAKAYTDTALTWGTIA